MRLRSRPSRCPPTSPHGPEPDDNARINAGLPSFVQLLAAFAGVQESLAEDTTPSWSGTREEFMKRVRAPRTVRAPERAEIDRGPVVAKLRADLLAIDSTGQGEESYWDTVLFELEEGLI